MRRPSTFSCNFIASVTRVSWASYTYIQGEGKGYRCVLLVHYSNLWIIYVLQHWLIGKAYYSTIHLRLTWSSPRLASSASFSFLPTDTTSSTSCSSCSTTLLKNWSSYTKELSLGMVGQILPYFFPFVSLISVGCPFFPSHFPRVQQGLASPLFLVIISTQTLINLLPPCLNFSQINSRSPG